MERNSKLSSFKGRVFFFREPCFFLCKVVFFLLFFFVKINNSVAQNTTAQLYPDWFLNTPQTGHFYAVGYSPVQFYDKSTQERAFSNLKIHLSSRLGLHLDVTEMWERLPDNSFTLRGREVLADTLNKDVESHSLASAVVGSMQIILGSTHNNAEFPKSRLIRPGIKPDWVNNPPNSDTHFYAVGIASLGPMEYMDWQRAEQNALFSLAHQKSSHIRMVERMLNYSIESVIVLDSNVLLHDIFVVARWRDDSTCYVLVRAM